MCVDRFKRAAMAAVLALTLPTGAAAEFDPDHTREVLVQNNCTDTWLFLLVHSPRPDDWRKAGFFRVAPNARIYPVLEGARLLHRDSAHLYFFAETEDGRLTTQGDHGINFEGQHYKGLKANRLLRGNTLELALTCG